MEHSNGWLASACYLTTYHDNKATMYNVQKEHTYLGQIPTVHAVSSDSSWTQNWLYKYSFNMPINLE